MSWGAGVQSDEFFHSLYMVASYLNNFLIASAQRSRTDLDAKPLTPNHFIWAKSMAGLARTAPLDSSYVARYKILIQTLARVWWRLIWELAPHLKAYPKWANLKRPLQKGDVSVMIEEGLRNHFPLVYIDSIDVSRDGQGRQLTFAQGKKLFHRNLASFVYLFSPDNQSFSSCLLYTSDAADE